jgi:hypothetical protein
MITFLREACSKDIGLKLFSLALAILIYSFVSIFAIKNDTPGPSAMPMVTERRTFYNLPVVIMSSAADVRRFKVTPEEVNITVQGDPKVLAQLQNSEIRALVDLTGIESAKDLRKRIDVSVPAGITQVSVRPTNEVSVLPPKR